MTRAEQADQVEAIAKLREDLKPGMTIYCILRHVSRSGMQREIALCYIENNQHYYITDRAARALGYRVGRSDGVVIGGCGMDMGFALVSSLSRRLYPDGFACTGKGQCPSNDHRNSGPDRDKYGDGVTHSSGDYALRHRWL